MSHEFILHHYWLSPFSERVRQFLAIKGVAWRSVETPSMLPKPDLVALTGGYRRRLGPRPRKSRQRFNFLLGHRQLDCLPPCCHDTNPRSDKLKRGIHEHTFSSVDAGFMESVV
jgi:hypothetical protein